MTLFHAVMEHSFKIIFVTQMPRLILISIDLNYCNKKRLFFLIGNLTIATSSSHYKNVENVHNKSRAMKKRYNSSINIFYFKSRASLSAHLFSR